MHEESQRPPYAAVAMISGAALAYEILLTRLFSIVQWHHFAYMIISLALLGFGASGTLLALTRRWWSRAVGGTFAGACALFGCASVACFELAQRLPFNALELLWDPWQPAWLLVMYVLLLVPFLGAAAGICVVLMSFPARIPRIYAADLAGAGAGAVAVVGLLYLSPPERVLPILAALGLAAAALASLHFRTGRGWTMALVLGALLAALVPVELRLSEFKELSQALNVMGTRVLDRRSGPLGALTTVASPEVPFRHAPGLSLTATASLPEQLAVFTDGDAPTMVNRAGGDPASVAYLDLLSSALPFHLLDRPNVLVLGAGGGTEVWQALSLGAVRVDAVELNPQLVRLVNETLGQFSGSVYSHPRVGPRIREARGFVAASRDRYDLIQVSLLDSFSTSSAGLHALSENYLYTVEAFGTYLDHLAPGGLLTVTRWLKFPPRDGIKVFATALAALEARGVDEPGAHLALMRSWNTTTLLVARDPLSDAQRAAIRAFCTQRWFDLAWLPGLEAVDTNRYNRWPEPWLHQAAVALLGPDREPFFERYKFNVRPATDDRPHFFRFLKWGTVPEIFALKEQGGLPLLEQGYLILVATLVQVLALSVLLVLLPLWAAHRRNPGSGGLPWRWAGYFMAVGLAFLMVEIAFIQKFILFLSHPVYAVVVVLGGFLVFAGVGSRVAESWYPRADVRHRIGRAIAAIGGLAVAYLLLLPWVFGILAGLTDLWRAVVSLALLAPLALFMGMPFPLALGRLRDSEVSWAWGVNGCASVCSAVLAALLAIHLGFTAVVLLAVALYGVAGALAPAGGPGRKGG